ncbi:hypothetical protein KIN20_023017 [Parelaphostrongylus tenuis]|nr:hypothetical protein KIN20_023017 [Parelaphostrongylus tenuis]
MSGRASTTVAGQIHRGDVQVDYRLSNADGACQTRHQQDVFYAANPSTVVSKMADGDCVNVEGDMIEVIAADELLTEAVEEVGDLANDKQYVYEYDSVVHTQHDQNIIFQLYQPLETSHGTFMCRICLELGETVEFDNRTSYAHHRYKVHGSYNNNHVCPVLHCREIYASMSVLRKHLCVDHKMPIEMHFRTFANVGDFERFRHLIETLCNCRFMMHAKQPHNRRQIMHCSKSEHKIILQSRRHKLPKVRMMKEGAWCPAQISFRTDTKTGRVDAFYQLFHYGHAREYRDHNAEGYVESAVVSSPNRPLELVFPEMPKRYADRPMQYVKIDLLAADSCVYLSTIYSHILIITDIKTGFMFAKPIPNSGVRQLLIRIVTDIFLQFGVPEGYSCSHSLTLIREVMKAINGIFCVSIKEVLHDTPDYGAFLRSLYEQAALELQSKSRWVEMVQFTTMVFNQSGKMSPFKRMFNRNPCNIPGHKVPPWLQNESFAFCDEDKESDAVLDGEDEQVQCDDHLLTNSPRFVTGDKVYLRNFENTVSRSNTLPYLYGYIGETDWENSPRFPYRVHFSKTKHPWPTESSESIWASSYDVLPTTHDLLVISQEERMRVASNMFCSCGGGDYGVPCSLFRSHLCTNAMAKACCLSSRKPCDYHEEYIDGDDNYNRMESLAKAYVNTQPTTKNLR